MLRFLKFSIAAALMSWLAATTASAHALLDSASPPVGGTVSGSPREIRLFLTQGIVPAFSGVTVTDANGAPVPTGKLAVDPSNPSIVIVRLGQALRPGAYTVRWHVVSVDTHPTQGSFRFTVAP
ncbi:copper homeostasis periplasmic binding protein CopC [Methylocapsa aurea]|uniref:copper homeostasis periplasmic binding protein CopC n=1 Tax=Methylocapsa aurea TaxID=663610 RepID=UPI00055CCB42|nr:copper homeostasis periplasmic binding protein CopC [Methylocapsa aurea]